MGGSRMPYVRKVLNNIAFLYTSFYEEAYKEHLSWEPTPYKKLFGKSKRKG